MATIPASAVNAYREALGAVSVQARSRARALVRAWCAAHPGDVAGAREYARAAVAEVVARYGDAAAEAACAVYDELAAQSGSEVPAAEIDNEPDEDQIERVARYQAGKLAGGDAEGFAESMASYAAYAARSAAQATVEANCRRDNVRYARVPSGSETCPWCTMLASRGFAYWSREAAGHASHRNCDCVVVPGFEGMDEVEGYDPDALYSDYLDDKFGTFKSKARGRSRTDSDRPSSRREFGNVGEMASYLSESPDLETLYSRGDEVQAALGEWFEDKKARDKYLAIVRRAASRRHGELSVGGKPGIVTYTKPRSELEHHESSGIDLLASHGIDVETIPEDGNAPANLDIVIDGKEWEMKNVTNARGSVSNQLNRIRGKWRKLQRDDGPRGVITCEGCEASLDEVCDGISLRIKDGERYLVVYSDGELRRVEK